ncbi:MAG TPA: hypothetical protein VFB12_06990 [Ktedonobacteraceae bacterium]|nr:hypothetical protein [Ktedonobacteraceae bacterium]
MGQIDLNALFLTSRWSLDAEKVSRHQDWHVEHHKKVSAVSQVFSQAIDDTGTMIMMLVMAQSKYGWPSNVKQ